MALRHAKTNKTKKKEPFKLKQGKWNFIMELVIWALSLSESLLLARLTLDFLSLERMEDVLKDYPML